MDERLTKRELRNGLVEFVKCDEINCVHCDMQCDPIDEALLKLKHYEDLEEQGLLLKLPCKVGDELFVKHRTFKDVIVKGVCIGYTWWRTDGFCIMFHSNTPTYGKVDIAFSEFGKTVFPTKAEAEKALAEMEK